MSAPDLEVAEALDPISTMLSADGYDLSFAVDGSDSLVAKIEAGPAACADCLVPKELMRAYFRDALRKAGISRYTDIVLLYPDETR